MIISRKKWMEIEGQIREKKLKIVKLRQVFFFIPSPSLKLWFFKSNETIIKLHSFKRYRYLTVHGGCSQASSVLESKYYKLLGTIVSVGFFSKASYSSYLYSTCVLLDFVSQGMRWIGKLHLEMSSLCYRGLKYTVTSPDIAHLALLCPPNKPDLEKVYISLIFSRLKFLVHSELLPISIELAEDSTESRLLQRMWLGEREHSQSSCPPDSQLLKQSF